MPKQKIHTVEIDEELDSQTLAGMRIDQPEQAFKIFQYLQRFDREKLIVIHFTAKGEVSLAELIAIGSSNKLVTEAGLILRGPVALMAKGIMLIHNHPSGDPEPTSTDIKLTKEVKHVAEHLNIVLLDHIIIGDKSFVSLKEYGEV